MAEVDTTAAVCGVECNALIEKYIRQIAAIQEAIWRLSTVPSGEPDLEIKELANIGGDLCLLLQQELGLMEKEAV